LDVPPRIKVQGMAVNIAQALGREPFAHAIQIEPELPGPQSLAHLGFLGFARYGLLEHSGCRVPRHHADPIVIGQHQIPRMNQRAGADHRDIHASQRFLDGALRVYVTRPDRKGHLGELTHIAHTGIDDESEHAACLERGRQQLAEVTGIRM
jgi:hypothetical protein